MKLRIFILFSLVLHFAAIWVFRSPEIPVQDLTEMQVLETLPTPLIQSPHKKMPAIPAIKAGATKARSSAPAASSTESKAAPAEVSNNMQAVSVGAVTEAPKVLQEKKISYPISARRAGVDGVVELKLVINREGRVQEAELVRGPGYGLNEAALDAIKDFVFSPAKIGNEVVAVRILYKYRFDIGGSR